MGADWHGDPKNARPGSIQNPDIFVNGSGGGPVWVGTVRALMRKLSRGDGLVGSGRPGRIGTVRALVCKLARGDGPGGSGRSGTVREQFHPTQLEKLLPRVLRRARETPWKPRTTHKGPERTETTRNNTKQQPTTNQRFEPSWLEDAGS